MLSREPGAVSALPRRRVLLHGLRGLLGVTLLGATATGCGGNESPAPDPLEGPLEAARRDADLAAAAARAIPALAPALTVVADERTRHATALVEEIARAARKPTPTSTSATATTTSAPAAPPPTVQDVVAALRASADGAAKLAPTLSGYRAGLLGSIAASCTTSASVALPAERRPQ